MAGDIPRLLTIAPDKPFLEIPEEEIDRIFAVNTKAVMAPPVISPAITSLAPSHKTSVMAPNTIWLPRT